RSPARLTSSDGAGRWRSSGPPPRRAPSASTRSSRRSTAFRRARSQHGCPSWRRQASSSARSSTRDRRESSTASPKRAGGSATWSKPPAHTPRRPDGDGLGGRQRGDFPLEGQPFERLRLDLAHSLARQAQLAADRLGRLWILVAAEAVAVLDHVLLALGQLC